MRKVIFLDADRALRGIGELSVYLVIIAVIAVVVYFVSRLNKKGENKRP